MALLGMFNVHRYDIIGNGVIVPYYPFITTPLRHHAMNSASILLYALTSFVAGFVSANFYRKINGENWVWNVVLTASLFAG